jgi:hypothetical protein
MDAVERVVEIKPDPDGAYHVDIARLLEIERRIE